MLVWLVAVVLLGVCACRGGERVIGADPPDGSGEIAIDDAARGDAPQGDLPRPDDAPPEDQQPEVADNAPVVELAYPEDGEVFGEATLVELRVIQSHWPVTVSFAIDGQPETVDDEPPYLAEFDPMVGSEGARVIRAFASNGVGESEVSITLYADRREPEIEILAPNADLNGPIDGILRVAARAEDEHGVERVELAVEGSGAPAIELTEPPWEASFDLSDFSLGVFTLRATAVDRAGRIAGDTLDFITCPDGRHPCGGVCRDPATLVDDVDFCGSCDVRCDAPVQRCVAGRCECTPGWTACGERCLNLSVDPRACGSCETTCPEGQGCEAGTCSGAIPTGFVLVPNGTFLMGAAAGEWGAADDEVRREVTISRAFLVGRHEVTQREWARFFDLNPSHFWDCGTECPVDSVTWWEAAAYANALSEAEGLEPCYVLGGCTDLPVGGGVSCSNVFVNGPGQSPPRCEGYRLPTEAEWELAYRAGTTTATYNGSLRTAHCEHTPHLAEIAWFECNSGARPRAVEGLLPNGFGLYDMAGNVSEWVWDYWRVHPASAVVDPLGGGAENHPYRLVKGGSWGGHAALTRAGARVAQNGDLGRPSTGFRVARTLVP